MPCQAGLSSSADPRRSVTTRTDVRSKYTKKRWRNQNEKVVIFDPRADAAHVLRHRLRQEERCRCDCHWHQYRARTLPPPKAPLPIGLKRTSAFWVGFKAGGTSDLGTRLLFEAAKEELGVNIIVDNVTGAGGWNAWSELKKAKPGRLHAGSGDGSHHLRRLSGSLQ